MQLHILSASEGIVRACVSKQPGGHGPLDLLPAAADRRPRPAGQRRPAWSKPVDWSTHSRLCIALQKKSFSRRTNQPTNQQGPTTTSRSLRKLFSKHGKNNTNVPARTFRRRKARSGHACLRKPSPQVRQDLMMKAPGPSSGWCFLSVAKVGGRGEEKAYKHKAAMRHDAETTWHGSRSGLIWGTP